jgi:S-DNA-T family DNA segregation ATPase FtsK/SpoIIIE
MSGAGAVDPASNTGGGFARASSAPAQAAGFARMGREALALLLFALALFVFLGLTSYAGDPHDPLLKGADWVGPVGAGVAGFMVQGFGVVAWLLPLELVLLGLPLLRGTWRIDAGYRIAADVLIAIILAALVQVAFPDARAFGALPASGNVGILFGEILRGLFSSLGSFLVGSTIVGLVLIGRAEFSFIEWSQRLAAFGEALLRWFAALSQRLGVAWIEAYRLRREQRRAEQAKLTPAIHEAQKDEAILARLAADDDSDWIPLEQTGPLPVALSQALREASARSEANAFLVETPEPAASKKKARPSRAKVALEAEEATPAAAPAEPALPEAAPLRGRRKKAVTEAPPEPESVTEDASDALFAAAEAPSANPAPETDLDEESEPRGARRTRKKKPSEPRIVDTAPEQATEPAEPPAKRTRTGYQFPPTDVLEQPPESVERDDDATLQENARVLEKTLADYGVSAKVTDIRPGPTVTTYEVVPAAGTKVSKIVGLADDLSLGLSRKVRITPLPERGRIGFELPNRKRPRVFLRDLIEHVGFRQLALEEPLPMVLGRDPVGAPFYADMSAMTHAIVAGATGAGKSVGVNVMLASLLFCRSPEELRLLMIDPKVVELAPFDRIPHLLLPVVTDMKQAATALRWAVDEMERRFQMFADAGTKNIKTYNAWVERVHAGEVPAPQTPSVEAISATGAVIDVPGAKEGGDATHLPDKIPYIVIVIDEFADLMMQQGKEVEASVARLAQKARAAGMHVLLATQRPSVDVITGMIKANFPTRIGFRVSQKVDSRTILDEQGAEMLLGKGDMLVKLNGKSDPVRIQCPFISEEEVNALTDFVRKQGAPQYHEAILAHGADEDDAGGEDEAADPRYDEAVRIVADTQRCSTSWLQRKMSIGYNRAAKIVETMEKRGVVGPANGAKDREVLISPL